MSKYFAPATVLLLASQFSFPVYSQALPDASVLYPELQQPRITPPTASPDFGLDGGKLEQMQPGGAVFELKGLRLSGNTVFSDKLLLAQVEDQIGKKTDFAGLQALANKLSTFYRERGYAFARVYLPRQDIKDGRVELLVSEGRYGDITATVDDRAAKRADSKAQTYLSGLESGEVIRSQEVERITLIMNDIPGYTAVPIVRPGEKTGTGDLELRMVEEENQLQGSFGLDNHGSQYTGEYRARLNLERSRNFMFGDQLKFTGLVTDKSTGMLYGGYAFPLMPNGLRMELSALYSSYELHGEGLAGFQGDASLFGAIASYPIVRSQTFNLAVSAGLQHKRYTNEVGDKEEYAINAFPLTLTFDKRDQLNGGGVTYGALSMLSAKVVSDNITAASRDTTFSKVNLDLVRLQRITDNAQATVKLAGQHTDDNIDATEFMSISGLTGVRAYPIGEFSGHKAWTAQTEFAYNLPGLNLTPYVFYDYGSASNTTTELDRDLSGYGLGLRYARAGYQMDAVAAWADKGRPSQVDPGATGAQIWIAISKRF